jgi:hypothetical protein
MVDGRVYDAVLAKPSEVTTGLIFSTDWKPALV